MPVPLNVLHVISSLEASAGGPTTALQGLAIAQRKAGIRTRVISTYSTSASSPAAEALRAAGVEVELIGPAKGRLMRHRRLRSMVTAAVERADVVHINAMWEQVQHEAARAAVRAGVPYVITPCGMMTGWSLSQSKWAKRLMLAVRVGRNLRRSAAIHYSTALEATESAVPHTRVLVEPNGVDLQEFQHLPAKGFLRNKFPQIGDRLILVFLGRIHPGKGVEHLIPALAVCPMKNVVLVVIGPDSENHKALIDSLIRAQGVETQVFFTGRVAASERASALADADLFCLPSDHENFGIAIIEALAAGVPVIVSRHVGIWREIVDAKVGSATGQDPAALGHELGRWLEDPTLRTAAAANAKAFVSERYDWSKIALRWETHYREILEGPAL
jgi:glycosyltransferase involved in cell wall biosynthesis